MEAHSWLTWAERVVPSLDAYIHSLKEKAVLRAEKTYAVWVGAEL